jgi:hypothetical protein
LDALLEAFAVFLRGFNGCLPPLLILVTLAVVSLDAAVLLTLHLLD